MRLHEALPIVQLVRSLARELEVEMGIAAGEFTRAALQQHLTEFKPWMVTAGAPIVPDDVERLLVGFSRINLLGVKYFRYEPASIEVQASAIGEQVAAGGVAERSLYKSEKLKQVYPGGHQSSGGAAVTFPPPRP